MLKIDVTMCFSNIISQFLLICFKVYMSEILDETDNFPLNYGK